jgi:tetratricopeptide (TPR) repeat protein
MREVDDAMANPDWYTGTDQTGQVAAGIEAVIERMDARTADHRDIDTLNRLLSVEREVNWRSFLRGLIGTIHYDLEEIETANKVLEESIAGYKVYLETFDEVLSVYCQSCYTLGVILFDAQKYPAAIPYFLRCLPYMHEVYDETYIGNIFTFLNVCYSWSDHSDAGLVFSEAAAFSRHCDCESLEHLMVAYGNSGELDKATEVFHLLQGHCQDYEHMDRVLDYAERNLGESSVVN